MAGIDLRNYQIKAIEQMKNGCILNGGVGSGKSRTSLAYYYKENGGNIYSSKYEYMLNPRDLYIITTARKRDTFEWEAEMNPFLISTDDRVSPYNHKVIIDSWNNIKKYQNVYGAFFIFDEQRLVGSGSWVKAFYKIAKKNKWILLSATPGDTWADYIPVFVANGFYKNKTELLREHAVYSRFTKYPKVEKFVNQKKLIRCKNAILISMDFDRQIEYIHKNISLTYDEISYRIMMKTRWNIYKDKPFESPSELCYSLRRLVYSDVTRQQALIDIQKEHPRLIVFYNFDYELEILKTLDFGKNCKVAEWNGHRHDPTPTTNKWVYLVQYTAGCEGWNCITTDSIVFYSQNYSYKVMTQAAGRTDRMNTPYKKLYYFHLKSTSNIEMAISRSLKNKKNFNENKYGQQYAA